MQTMSNPITRRTALAGAGALPLLPVSAYAGTDDPAVKAYEQWRAAYDAFSRAFDRSDNQDGCPILKATHDQEFAARLALSDAVATTPAGLARQVRFAFDVFGERISDAS
jgi:hypothetical protein